MTALTTWESVRTLKDHTTALALTDMKVMVKQRVPTLMSVNQMTSILTIVMKMPIVQTQWGVTCVPVKRVIKEMARNVSVRLCYPVIIPINAWKKRTISFIVIHSSLKQTVYLRGIYSLFYNTEEITIRVVLYSVYINTFY